MESRTLRRVARLAVWLVLPLGVFAAVIGVLLGELAAVDHELQIIAPREARPGATVPMQALFFAGVSGDAPPSLEPMSVVVRVLDPGGRELSRARLRPSPAGGAAGMARAPEVAGDVRLVAAVVRAGETLATLELPLRVAPDARPAELVGRSARALQHFAPGPVVPAEGRLPPAPFDVRVRGGACVPEVPCALLVHVGDPAAAVRLVPNAAVSPTATRAAEETSGLEELTFVVHGPEASATLEATRGGEVVGSREVRVPVALATPGLEVARPLGPGRPQLHVHVLGDRPGLIVDAYRDGAWIATHAFPGDQERLALPRLPPGLSRLEVRTDPFTSRHVAVRHVAFGAPSAEENLLRALPEIRAHTGERAAPPEGPPELRLAWAAAPLEEGHYPLPPAVSGRAADEARVASRQATLRGAALLAMILGVFVLALVFVRRGIDAAQQAYEVMAATGDAELASARHRRRTLLDALALVAVALVAFVGAAAMVIARARLLD